MMRTIICIALVIFGYWSAVAQSKYAASDFSNLTLEIRTNKQNYLPLEPIGIIIKLSNLTNNDILSHGSLDFSSNFIELFVQDERGQIKRFDQLSFERARVAVQEKFIPPQASIQKPQTLSINLDKYLAHWGKYKIKGVFYNKSRTKSITSTWISLRIVQPTDINLSAFNFLKNQKNISVFLHAVTDKKDIESLEKFVATFSGSDYNNYALFLLADYYMYIQEFSRAKEKLVTLKVRRDFLFSAEVEKALEKIARENL